MTVTRRDIEDALSDLGIAVRSISSNGSLDSFELPEVNIIGNMTAPRKPQNRFIPKRILKNGDYMTVLWDDGTKTIVKRAADEPASDYAAFTACLGIKCFGSNSALKRIVASAEERGKKKKKQNEGNAEEGNPFEKVARELSKAFHEGDILRALEDIKEGNRAAYK